MRRLSFKRGLYVRNREVWQGKRMEEERGDLHQWKRRRGGFVRIEREREGGVA